MKLLYVEDNPTQVRAMQKVAHMAGYEFCTAITGGEGLELLRELPDLIIVDVQLPDMNGLDLAAHIRERYPRAPIIAVSASGLPEDRMQALSVGCVAFIQKPFRFLEMVERLKTYKR
jgi:two-component system, cell cycle response regulator DivK